MVRVTQMCDMPFVPVVDSPTDTRYFAESNDEERAITASLSLSMCLPEPQEDEDVDKSALKDEAFEGFDYSNLFNLREMNEQAENQQRLRLSEVSSGLPSENDPERTESVVAAAENKEPSAISFSEEGGEPVEAAHDLSEDSPNALSFCDVKVKVSGDYIHYTFDFQQDSESE